MTTYTVLNRNGEVIVEGASLTEAAREVLYYDGHDFEFRRRDGWLDLWVTPFSRNSTLGGRPMVRAADMFAPMPREMSDESPRRAEAEQEIYRMVIDHSDRWNGLDAMTDEQYAEVREAANVTR